MDIWTHAIAYVISDPYFWPSMALTAIVGMYVAAAIYDGETEQIKKVFIVLLSYAALIVMTTYARISGEIDFVRHAIPGNEFKPVAGIVTTLIITLFYVFGMAIGMVVTRIAHNGKRG